MSLQLRAQHMAELLSRHTQQPYYDRFRDAYFEGNDFDSFDADDDFTVTNATAGTADVIDGAGGILELDSASTTADQGVQVQHKTETILPADGKPIIFEARLKISEHSTGVVDSAQIFVGLSVLDTTIMASGANSSTDHIGWESNAVTVADVHGRLDFHAEKGGDRASVSTAHTYEANDTYVILGFFVDGIGYVTPLVNGIAGTSIETGSANIPVTAGTGDMAASFLCQSEGTHDPTMDLDWYYVIQAR